MGTPEIQRSPVELAADAYDFMQHVGPKISEQNHDATFIINMDQTPIFFTCHPKKTLEWKRTKIVNIFTSTNDNDGSKLPSMLIFKGNENGWIVKEEFHLPVYLIARKMHG